ncbi:hypothetical protein JDV02_002303 [Purpureocillium takamizusanense]|uniref:Uncharacterized protein n=1 Tax=Purpureocillium takamizusanense TaxID=2060973 RepID=A0A9Q8QA14_9HYPO|nr:uncharacterized protein JDV02_002303 [Purpureocillium takamizusanense]UNI15805.1 hypothetical protein JDV02_002303 [Purpureocillium takamizusanense]
MPLALAQCSPGTVKAIPVPSRPSSFIMEASDATAPPPTDNRDHRRHSRPETALALARFFTSARLMHTVHRAASQPSSLTPLTSCPWLLSHAQATRPPVDFVSSGIFASRELLHVVFRWPAFEPVINLCRVVSEPPPVALPEQSDNNATIMCAWNDTRYPHRCNRLGTALQFCTEWGSRHAANGWHTYPPDFAHAPLYYFKRHDVPTRKGHDP